MLDLINRYAHGFVAVPVILACKEKALFKLLQHHGSLTLEQIVERLGANGGHLQVALRMMQSLNWLSQNEFGAYSLTNEAEIHKKIPEEILDLYHLPIKSYLMGQQSGLLKVWIERSRQRWNVDDPMIADFLDGILIIPILLTLHKHNLLVEDEHKPLFSQLSDPVREELYELFTNKGWALRQEGRFCLTDVGRFIVERALITGTTASYTPMLSRMTDVLFGDCQAVFRRDASGQESHVDRTLNVVASGFQHEKYFADVENIILSIFNRLPVEEQPKYVVDMGCGDGTLLKRVYETIRSKSARGKVLDQYPLRLIGVDYNEASITVTARTLADIPHLVLKGDIGDPEQMITSMNAHGIQDRENILHIRSFLDHDRPFISPQKLDKVQDRSGLPYQGVYVDPNGESIPAHVMVQSLVEHLERWSRVVTTKHGLIILEVHCLEPDVVNRFLDKNENLHFDAYQAFSMQHLVEADVFLMAAAEVGLFPKVEFSKRYPKTFPFTRITLNCFEKRPYTIRHLHLSDLRALVDLENKCWPEHLRASSDEIRQRIERFPNGHCVLEMDGQVAGVIYSQRISSTDALKNMTYVDVPSLHTRLGSVIQLLGINIDPEMQVMGLGEYLREFMLQWCTLKGNIERVVGITRCKNYVNYANVPITEYIRQHNELGQLLDPILRFHKQGGAVIKGIIPNYRPEDVDNLGNGVLIEYDIHNRLQSHSSTVVKVEPVQKRLKIELKENETLDDVIEGCIRLILGDQHMAAFVQKRHPIDMGLDSLELLELRTLLSERLGVELEPTFFFEYRTTDAIARYFKGLEGEDVGTLPNLDEQEKSGWYDSDLSEDQLEDLLAQEADVKVRLARPEDTEPVLAFCQQTWEHSSDNILLSWDKWLADPTSRIFVAEIDGLPVAITGVNLMSEREAWWQGLRVDPQCRRRGQGFFLTEVLRNHIEQYLLEANIKISRSDTCSNNTFIHKYYTLLNHPKVGCYIPYKADAIDSPPNQIVKLNINDFNLAWAVVTNSDLFSGESYLYLSRATKWQELTQQQLINCLNEGRVWGLKQKEQLLSLVIQMPVHSIDYLEGANEALWKGAHQTWWIGYADGTDEGLTTLLHELRQLAHNKGYLAVGGFFPITDRILKSLNFAGYQQAEELEYWIYEWQIQNQPQ